MFHFNHLSFINRDQLRALTTFSNNILTLKDLLIWQLLKKILKKMGEKNTEVYK